ncbi:enhancer of mRNA-decapping protein 3 [Petromyzon marinus]|uniref:Enhancer of mRNA-decapping protein 3 n=1 Tax=Petromyzon marinus TaxID=7757 RepID=A0AAJ7U906_PETMA|nr:enhancer of mRNA-decapping protein 3 [Petromyzon marinus]XP_032831883.1 enhancer of mRNA-decapping protein 3 [Petromyzon marinus]
MEDRWGGCVVSLNCGPVLGVYQGRVSRVDQQCQSISLVQPFRNGARCTVPELTLSATDIKELKILELPPEPASFQHTQMLVDNGTAPVAMTNGAQSASHPIARRGEREAEAADSSSQQQQQQQPPSSRAHTDVPGSTPSKGFRRRHNSWSSSNRQALMGTTPKRNAGGRGGGAGPAAGGRRSGRDEDCFADDLDDLLDTEFDFEKNLALFDKAAVFQEIEMHHGGGGPASVQSNGAAARTRGTPPADTQKYRHDENVLAAAPSEFHRIDVPQPGPKLYCTDTGMVVPSVSPALHRQLLGAAERAGLTAERRRDVLGVCATQMALSLLGGSNRMDPKNSHQRPTVVVLCGPHRRGAQGACVARHLANRDVHVIALVPRAPPGGLAEEVRLLERTTTARCVGSVAELPGTAVDLVVECLLGDPDESPGTGGGVGAAGPLGHLKPPREAAAWAAANLAPLLAVDPPPPAQNAPSKAGGVAFAAKWSLVLGLPSSLGEGAGRVYLCDVGIPVRVFEEVGIAYHSPFGCKFVIPLHST